MIGNVGYLFMFAFLMAVTSSLSKADVVQAREHLLSDYYQFVQAFEANDKEQLKMFLDSQSKFGQEIGGSASALLEYTDNENNCRERLLNAMYAGCKHTTEGESSGCIAPPQAEDNSVIYIGPRIAFASDSTGKSFMLQFVVCGTD